MISIEPKITNLRLENQCGLFILSGSYDKKFNEYFEFQDAISNQARKLIIKKSILQDVLRLLMDTGVNNRKIYPGIDGVAKDIAVQLKMKLIDKIDKGLEGGVKEMEGELN